MNSRLAFGLIALAMFGTASIEPHRDVHDEVGEWYLVTPSGKMVKG